MQRIHSYDEKAIDFSKIDHHAKQATNKDMESFQALIGYLSRIQGDSKEHSQLLLARGLIVWIAHTQNNIIPDNMTSEDSPTCLVTLGALGLIPYEEAFQTFCRYAGIDCRIVTGRVKSAAYQVGDDVPDDSKKGAWNIITADGHQHLIQPYWILSGIIGRSEGGETILEADGEATLTETTEHSGYVEHIFEEFWFCTNPKIFAIHCYPDDPVDQFLVEGEMVKSVDEFFALPFLEQFFFMSNLSLMSEKSCRINSSNGKCRINLLVNRPTKPNSLNFSYTLSIIGSNTSGLKAEDIPRLVLFSRNQDVCEFEIRFPITGVYRFKLDVRTGDFSGLCCEFRIECTEVDPNCRKLPFDSGIEGYGFGPSAEEAGLKNPSEPGGTLYVDPTTLAQGGHRKNKMLKFQTEEDCIKKMDYFSELYSVDGKGKTVTHFGKSKTVVDPSTCNMSVEIAVSKPGEYALKINSKPKGRTRGSDTQEVARYIVSTDTEVYKNQLEVKLKKREVTKESKIAAKEETKRTLLEEHEVLHNEIQDLLKKI